ncbi:MAG: ATP-binding protein [Spirochaetaceae bacterium]
MTDRLNTRILVIDDEEAIRASFKEILAPRRRDQERLSSLSRQLFGEEESGPRAGALFDFEVDLAPSGEAGLEQVLAGERAERPYAAIFVDVRMPGLDGLETVQEIRKHDSRAEIIFITAYSDYEIEEIVSRAGANVGYHTKPFAPEEIRQLATKAVYEWNKNISLERLISVVSELRTNERALDVLLVNILQQVAMLLGSHSALIAARKDHSFEHLLGMGLLADQERARSVLSRLPSISDSGVYHDQEAIYYGMERYGVVALFEGGSGVLTNHRIYMARLFLEEAAQAIQNAELREELLRKEKLSAVGQGVSMVAHDLRSPLGNILSLTDLLEDELPRTDQNRELVSLIRSSANSATSIIADILDFARGGGIDPSDTDTRELSKLIEREARRMAEDQGIALAIEDNADVPLRVDLSKLSRALINLLRNSCEALSRNAPNGPPRITVLIERQDGQVVFTISDNGPGLPQEVVRDLFVPFATGDSQERRTGLGLAIVKHFVDLHEGQIDFNTGPGGTTFVLRIPA